jgi:flagellar hook-associated protein 3 FlgL
MRISTSSIYQTATNQMGSLSSQLARTQQQLATNKRLLTAADDPVASARALEVTQSQSVNSQFATNRRDARSALGQVETTLTSVTSLIQDVQEIAVAANKGSLSQADRESYATELDGRLQDLLALANTTDGVGNYVFSGFKSGTQPYQPVNGAIAYQGDQGQVEMQIGPKRSVPVSVPGSNVFGALAGSGSVATAAKPGNLGAASVSTGTVVDSARLTGHNYQIVFAVGGAPATTGYTVQDLDTGANVMPAPPSVTPLPYVSGEPIAFDGISLKVTGTPANGDTFSVAPGSKQTIFGAIEQLATLLRTPSGTDAENTAAQTALGGVENQLATALDKVLTVRASVGASAKELDYLDDAGDAANVQYAATLSDLQDLDMTKAISLFTQQQMSLQAAQQSFKAMSGLSLFNYIS